MVLSSEISQPVQVERKAPVLKAKAQEVVKKIIPERTRQWLLKAGKKLQRGKGREALETLSTPPTDSSIQKESKKTSTTPPSLQKTEDLKDKEIAMGMRKSDETKKTSGAVPVTVEKAKESTEQLKQNEETSGDTLKGKNIETLVQQKDNPEAQLEAIVLMSNGYRNFNVRNNSCMGWLADADVGAISKALGLNTESVEGSRQALLGAHRRFSEISSRRNKVDENLRYAWDDRKPELQKRQDELINQENQATTEMHRLYRELMLPVRTAVLSLESLPETYKLNVIEGIKDYGEVLPEEDSLLKRAYMTNNKTIKRQIADTVTYNIGHDLNSFDVIPINDLISLGADVDKIFIATLGNTKTNGEFVESKVAPVFFPDENPEKVRQSYEALRKVTGLENKSRETSFYSDGYNHDTKSMNVDFFKSFMNNSERLIPLVEVLSDYGFQYRPCNFFDGKLSQQYIEVLQELGQNLTQLRTELNSIKTIVPDYKFDFKVDTRYPPTRSERETYVDDNPFAIALKQKTDLFGIKTTDQMNETVKLFESLQKVVPERWKSGLISTYIEMMSTAAGYSDRSTEMTKKAISEASKYIFDSSITPDQVELFATSFFESSLDAKNENITIAVKFCEQHADRIRTVIDGQKRVDANSTWYKLSLLASDLYRYPIVSGREDVAIAKAKSDLAWASEVVTRITDPTLKDRGIANLVYALTDEEVGDLQKAQLFVDSMKDDFLKKDAQVEIGLEKERAAKGETTTWKKMEKVKRSSEANEKFLRNIFGYGTSEDLSNAREQYYQQFHSSPDQWATVNPENQAKLEQEIARIRDNFNVTLNITWANVLSTLETGRVISAWENTEVMEYRNKYGKYNYEERRDEIERLLGNRAKGGIRDPHPIYGAAASSNNRDEYYGGTGGGYGECFLVLKKDQIKDRTSFVYDDSFDGYNRWTMDLEGGITAKAIHNLSGSESRHGYVEAEILGGVSIDDIDSINIPSDAIFGENKYGFSIGSDVLSKIDQLRQRYPDIRINIIQVPTT